MTRLYPPRLYPHLQLEENRRALERERALRRRSDEVRLKAREQRRSARTPLLSHLGQALHRTLRDPRDKEAEEMHGVIVEFEYGENFEPNRIAAIAREARGLFEALPGLRQKAFMIDMANRRATNVYLWESEEQAHGFFTDALVERVAAVYGLRPSISFVEVAELVENSGAPRNRRRPTRAATSLEARHT
jgi:hypothetical protein